jgi:anti-sigma factor RsiW
MGGREDFDRALEAIVAEKREQLGEPPTPEELLAYLDGELDDAARQVIEAKIAVYPDAARALADLASFPDVEPAPGTVEPTDEEIAATWQALRQRLGETRPAAPPPRVLAAPSRPRRLPAWKLAAAAALVLAAWTAGFLMGRSASAPQPEAAVNVVIAELSPLETAIRSSPAAVELPARSEELVLVLGLAADADEGPFADYRAEIVDASGGRLWSRQGLRPTPLGTFHLAFRRGALAPGTYQIHLYGQEGERNTLLATYGLQLLEESGG